MMQFLPKGAMNNVVSVYAYSKEPPENLIKVGSAWKRRRQMTMRLDLYRDMIDSFETYQTSDGQVFMPLMISKDAFANLGTSEMGMGFSEADVDEIDKELVGYIRSQGANFKVSVNMGTLAPHMAENRYGKSIFTLVPMSSMKGILEGSRAVGAVSLRRKGVTLDRPTPFLINRNVVRFR